MLPTQLDLGNDRKDDDDGSNNKRDNLVNEHTTENKNKKYSQGQVHQTSNRLLMNSGSSIMIAINPKLLGKSCHPHDWTFDTTYNNNSVGNPVVGNLNKGNPELRNLNTENPEVEVKYRKPRSRKCMRCMRC